MEKAPDRRYQTARELMVDLRNLQRDLEQDFRGGPLQAFPPGRAEPAEGGEVELEPIEALSSSDIFVSFARVDDRPVLAGRSGWVSQFYRNLELRIEQLSGEPVKIWPHPNPPGDADADQRVLQGLANVKAMVSVVSPPFFKSNGYRHFPEHVAGIPIGRTAARLHFLHSAGWGSFEPNGTQIARYVVHFDQGPPAEIPVVAGRHLRDWWVQRFGKVEVSDGQVAWRGPSGLGADRELAVYQIQWDNPHPDREIVSVDLISEMTDAAPFVLAITADEPGVKD